MQGIVSTSKVNELIWHALTANGVKDRWAHITWVWDECPIRMRNCIGKMETTDDSGRAVFKIRLSTDCFKFATEEQREHTIIHEACHVAECLRVGHAEHAQDAHGTGWKDAMTRAGYIPSSHTVIKMDATEDTKQIRNLT